MGLPELSVIATIHLVLLVWALWDLLSSRRTGCGIILWIIFIAIAPVLGPILYLLFGRARRE
jgi:hypothetical protein